jgi:predicted nucleic acid-binding protein
MDCLIATIAIRNNATVLHKDRDFSQISKITSLKQEKI